MFALRLPRRAKGYLMDPILTRDATTRAALEHLRAQDRTPYRRERAAALLNIADGATPTAVARTGLLPVRDHETVNRWVTAFQADGLASLTHRPSRRARERRTSPAAGPTVHALQYPPADRRRAGCGQRPRGHAPNLHLQIEGSDPVCARGPRGLRPGAGDHADLG